MQVQVTRATDEVHRVLALCQRCLWMPCNAPNTVGVPYLTVSGRASTILVGRTS